MGIVSTINVPHHHFTVSLSQNMARDTPPGILTICTFSLSFLNKLPPLSSKNVAFCEALLTVHDREAIVNLIQFDAVQFNVPELLL